MPSLDRLHDLRRELQLRIDLLHWYVTLLALYFSGKSFFAAGMREGRTPPASLCGFLHALIHRIIYRHFPFSPIALKHRERQRGCALRRGGLLLRYRICPEFVDG